MAAITILAGRASLNGIKSRTVGDGQHGTARWATDREVKTTYAHVPFRAAAWRSGKERPTAQGLILGSVKTGKNLIALVDSDDVHCLMIGASGVGKTAFFLYPNLEYACASGMSFLALDTKGDLARNYGAIARDCYGFQVSVIDLRNPTRSDGGNLLTLVNRYMDRVLQNPNDLAAQAKAEKYAKILAKTIVNPEGDSGNRGQNAYFYEAAESLLASVILLLAEFLPPRDGKERRHIVSVFKLIQDLLESSPVKGKNRFQLLMSRLPSDHKARWMAGSALNAADQAMASVLSTVMSRLNVFLDSEMEQVLCFDSSLDAEAFVREPSAIFLILPEEDTTKNFMASLMIQNLSRELFKIADDNGGRLPNRAVLFCDEFGTMPPFDVLPLFSAGRSRGLTLVPIIQSLAQLEKNYGKEGAEIIMDNVQDTIFGGFAPQQSDGGGVEQSHGQPDGALRLCEPGKGQRQQVAADDGAGAADAGRAEVPAQGDVYRDEDRYSPHADAAAAVPGVGHHLRRSLRDAGPGPEAGVLCGLPGAGVGHRGALRAAVRRTSENRSVKGDELFSDNLCRGTAPPGGGSVHVPAGPLQWRRDLLAVYRYHCPGTSALPQHCAAGLERPVSSGISGEAEPTPAKWQLDL